MPPRDTPSVSRTGASAWLLGRNRSRTRRHAAAACVAFTVLFVATFVTLVVLREAFPRWPVEPSVLGVAGTELWTAGLVLAGGVALVGSFRFARAGGGLVVSLLAGVLPVFAYYSGWRAATGGAESFWLYLGGSIALGLLGFVAGVTARRVTDRG